MLLWLLIIGGVGALFLAFMAMRGPSAAKASSAAMELIKERHGDVIAGNAQAQIRKLFAERGSKLEGYASTLIPKPALLRKRLEQTGKEIRLGKYAMVCLGVISAWSRSLLAMRGAPFILSLMVGIFFGVGGPHFVIGRMIKRRINKFNSNFPDAIELMVRGLRSGLPITETLGIVAGEIPGPVGIEFRMVSDKMKIGRTMEAALQDTADRLGTAEFQFFVITLADPARDRRQPRRNAVESCRRASQARPDEAQDPGDELGIQGFRLHRRLAAVRCLHARVDDQPPLHGRVSSPTSA